ncbi:MAG: hypothetical protein J2P32_11035 [Actinobacteria bacterium]|nr:hypothetical protein [Actinomycetota bacterium]
MPAGLIQPLNVDMGGRHQRAAGGQGGKLRPHGRDKSCPGSGTPASKARRQQPARDGSSASAVSGGAFESDRRRH